MGLELVEIVMEVEDEFGIAILEEEGIAMLDMGQLHACVLRKLQDRDSKTCLSAFIFYRLRRALVDCLHIDRGEIFPQRPLHELIPVRRQRAVWKQIEQSSRLAMPMLQNPPWARALVISGLLPIAAALLFVLVSTWGYVPASERGSLAIGLFVAALFLVLIWLWLCGAVTSRFQRIPTRLQTVGDWVHAVVKQNFGDEQKQMQTWTPAQVWEKLQTIVAGVTGLKRERITPQSTWRDLGI